ncbi:hypothetical protein [Methylosinus sp. PW1]|uniref:hypothetical protein n=1 Tax=Methylosinus sp. PW1 TaxID=107636 RepID=UPI001FDA93B5|nr:hypothetical protein [Methylosinus sp. PW1]
MSYAELAARIGAPSVNRHRKLTPDRRSKLTPFWRRAERERSPRRSWRGCAAGASAFRFAM